MKTRTAQHPQVQAHQLSPFSGTTTNPAAFYTHLTRHGFDPMHPRQRSGSEFGWLFHREQLLLVTVYGSGLILVAEGVVDGRWCDACMLILKTHLPLGGHLCAAHQTLAHIQAEGVNL